MQLFSNLLRAFRWMVPAYGRGALQCNLIYTVWPGEWILLRREFRTFVGMWIGKRLGRNKVCIVRRNRLWEMPRSMRSGGGWMSSSGSNLRPSASWSNGLLPSGAIKEVLLPSHLFYHIFCRHLGLTGPNDCELHPHPSLTLTIYIWECSSCFYFVWGGGLPIVSSLPLLCHWELCPALLMIVGYFWPDDYASWWTCACSPRVVGFEWLYILLLLCFLPSFFSFSFSFSFLFLFCGSFS